MDSLEQIELIGALLGKTEEETEELHEDWGLVEDLLYAEFDVDTETFAKIAKALLKLCPVIETAVTGTKYHAFMKGDVILARLKAET